MAKGIKDKVAIIGMGCCKFGERWDAGAEDLMIEAFKECMDDAGIEKKDIEAAWLGNSFDEHNLGKTALKLTETLKMPFIPATRVENLCATGIETIRAAAYAVAAGAFDIVLALGVEKLKDTGFRGLPEAIFGTKGRFQAPNATAPGEFAMLATKYFSKYRITPEEGKRMLAHVSVKSHHAGALNPKAHIQREVSIEEVIEAPIVAWPLGLYDCCSVSDGAAAAILVRADMAKEFRKDPVLIKSTQVSASSGDALLNSRSSWDGTYIPTTREAAKRAYQEVGIESPRREISMAEVHDCFSITEAVTMEDLQFSPVGKVKEDIESCRFDLDGEQPVQMDGGLKCFGHPLGASGIRMTYEIYKQLQGKAGKRQIENPQLGLVHNFGGIPPHGISAVNIYGL